MKKITTILLFSLALISFACTKKNEETKMAEVNKIDEYSFNLGVIAAFSEMVDIGLKKLAFSSTLRYSEADSLFFKAEETAAKYNVKIYREKELIVTKLFPADVAKNFEVFIMYSGNDIQEYLALKTKITELVKNGGYTIEEQINAGKALGKLLGYPEEKIKQLITKN